MASSPRNKNQGFALPFFGPGVLFVVAFVALVIAVSYWAVIKGANATHISIVGFTAFSIIIVAFAAAVLWKIVNGEVKLAGLISELDEDDKSKMGKASLSRFQFLIFTFVVAGLFLMLSIETGGFVEIPTNVLGLLGISGGSFIVSKAVGMKPKPSADPAPDSEGGS
jgi:hypothetical protein